MTIVPPKAQQETSEDFDACVEFYAWARDLFGPEWADRFVLWCDAQPGPAEAAATLEVLARLAGPPPEAPHGNLQASKRIAVISHILEQDKSTWDRICCERSGALPANRFRNRTKQRSGCSQSRTR